jgi:hypothetical protein
MWRLKKDKLLRRNNNSSSSYQHTKVLTWGKSILTTNTEGDLEERRWSLGTENL